MAFCASIRSPTMQQLSLLSSSSPVGSSGGATALLVVNGIMKGQQSALPQQLVSAVTLLGKRSYSSCRQSPTTTAVVRGCGRGTNATSIGVEARTSHRTPAAAAAAASIRWTSTKSSSPSSSPSSSSSMKDEYGEMTSEGETYQYSGEFVLENGQVLQQPQLRYMTYGTLNERRDNVLVICHALTGNASLHGWWGGLLGPQRAFDTSQYYVICCNILGSCYGSTSPQSINPLTQRAFGKDFPDVSVQDTVRLQLLLLQEHLQIASVESVIGGSFGGMQAIEFAVQGGSSQAPFTTAQGSPFVRSVIPIACGVKHTAWQIAISEVQRQAIYADPMWNSDTPQLARAGLSVARQMGMISYRTPQGYQAKFGRRLKGDSSSAASSTPPTPAAPIYGSEAPWQVKSYLEYQGIKFLDRFDPVTYVKLTEQMDSHDVSRNRGESVAEVLSKVTIPARILGIDSDILYPLTEQKEMAQLLPRGELKVIHSEDGHDGFLLEQDQVANYIQDLLETIQKEEATSQQ